jgi:hypothetical protein
MNSCKSKDPAGELTALDISATPGTKVANPDFTALGIRRIMQDRMNKANARGENARDY